MPNQYLLTPFFLDQTSAPIEDLARPGWRLNNAAPSGNDQLTRMGSLHARLRDLVEHAVGRRACPVSVAGDCCAAIPVLAGLQRAGLNPTVVWLDAHGDFNTHETTISGFIGGMPLAMMTGRGSLSLLKAAGAHPVLDSAVILADARDLDPAERLLLAASGVNHVTNLRAVLDALPPDGPIHLHLDFDVLDAAETPAMRYPVRNGPSLAQLVSLGEALRKTGRIAAISATTWDLEADPDGQTGDACLRVLSAFAGEELGARR